MSFIDDKDYRAIQDEVGRSFKIWRQSGSTDDYGQPTYADSGLAVSTCGIIQDMSTKDVQEAAGMLELGDKWLFTTCSVTINPEDQVEIDSVRFRTVERTFETVDRSTAVYKTYVIRKLVI